MSSFPETHNDPKRLEQRENLKALESLEVVIKRKSNSWYVHTLKSIVSNVIKSMRKCLRETLQNV